MNSSSLTLELLPRRGSRETAGSAGAFAGLPNFLRKEASEWLRTRRALWTALAAQALLLLGVLAMRIYASIDPNAKGIDLTPNFSMYKAGWETVLPICAVFSTIGLLAGERENRTLAWSLSMPLSRGAVLAAKLVTTIVALGVVTVLLPLITTLAAVRLAYGDLPDAYSLWAPLLTGVALSFFLVVVNLAASTFFRSQRTVTAIALVIALVVPGLIGSLWEAAAPWWPMSIEFWIKGLARSEPVNWITPLVYALATVGLLVAAQVRFAREEL